MFWCAVDIKPFQTLADAVLMRRCLGIAIRDGAWHPHGDAACDADPWAVLENRWAEHHRVKSVRARHGNGLWAVSIYQGGYVGPVPLCSMISISEEHACKLLAGLDDAP
jgi:hypothetical protein